MGAEPDGPQDSNAADAEHLALLVRTHLLSQSELDEAVREAIAEGTDVETILTERHGISRRAIGFALNSFYKRPFIEFDEAAEIHAELIGRFDPAELKAGLWVPLRRTGDAVHVLIHDPQDAALKADIEARFPAMSVRYYVGSRQDILHYVGAIGREPEPMPVPGLGSDPSNSRGRSLAALATLAILLLLASIHDQFRGGGGPPHGLAHSVMRAQLILPPLEYAELRDAVTQASSAGPMGDAPASLGSAAVRFIPGLDVPPTQNSAAVAPSMAHPAPAASSRALGGATAFGRLAASYRAALDGLWSSYAQALRGVDANDAAALDRLIRDFEAAVDALAPGDDKGFHALAKRFERSLHQLLKLDPKPLPGVAGREEKGARRLLKDFTHAFHELAQDYRHGVQEIAENVNNSSPQAARELARDQSKAARAISNDLAEGLQRLAKDERKLAPPPGPAARPEPSRVERLAALTRIPAEEIQAMRESGMSWSRIEKTFEKSIKLADNSWFRHDGGPSPGKHGADPAPAPAPIPALKTKVHAPHIGK